MEVGSNSIEVSVVIKYISVLLVGAAGALAMYFNDIINGDAKFSFVNFLMLVFIGAVIGFTASVAAPLFGVNENYIMVFSCCAAAAHKYVFKSISWILEKWTTK